MKNCRLKIIKSFDELDKSEDPEFYDNIPLELLLDAEVDMRKNLEIEHENFIYLNEEDGNKICAVIRFYIVQYRLVRYAFIYMVGSRSYFNLEYRGNGRMMFAELLTYLKEEKGVSIACITQPSIIGWEMYVKIGFRVVGDDNFLYYKLRDVQLNCKVVATIITVIRVVLYFDKELDPSHYKRLNRYPSHGEGFEVSEEERVRIDKRDQLYGKNRPYYDKAFIEEHTDLFKCNFNKESLHALFKKISEEA